MLFMHGAPRNTVWLAASIAVVPLGLFAFLQLESAMGNFAALSAQTVIDFQTSMSPEGSSPEENAPEQASDSSSSDISAPMGTASPAPQEPSIVAPMMKESRGSFALLNI